MNAGTLNEIISIYKPDSTEGKYGPNKVKYIPFIEKIRARVIWNNGARANDNNEIVYDYNITFKIRYYHKIDEYMRIKWNEKNYRIINIIPDKHLNEINIQAELINE